MSDELRLFPLSCNRRSTHLKKVFLSGSLKDGGTSNREDAIYPSFSSFCEFVLKFVAQKVNCRERNLLTKVRRNFRGELSAVSIEFSSKLSTIFRNRLRIYKMWTKFVLPVSLSKESSKYYFPRAKLFISI